MKPLFQEPPIYHLDPHWPPSLHSVCDLHTSPLLEIPVRRSLPTSIQNLDREVKVRPETITNALSELSLAGMVLDTRCGHDVICLDLFDAILCHSLARPCRNWNEPGHQPLDITETREVA